MSVDRRLLHAWRAGDRRAGSKLFARHFDSVRRFFLNKVETNVEDLVQRTFVACVEGRDRFREECSFRSFMFAIAHNLLREHLRGATRAVREVDFGRTSIADLGSSPTSLLARRDEEALVIRALQQIPVDAQVLIELYYWEDLTGPELAAILGVPEETARSRLRRAKELLQAAIRRVEKGGCGIPETLASLSQWARGLRSRFPPAR